jgi:hypothetical protein
MWPHRRLRVLVSSGHASLPTHGARRVRRGAAGSPVPAETDADPLQQASFPRRSSKHCTS